jgi:hypothetical protein
MLVLFAKRHRTLQFQCLKKNSFLNPVRFVLYDPKTQLWYEVSEEYAREKVSHSLRDRRKQSRQHQHRGGTRPTTTSTNKIRKRAVRKQTHSPALDDIVQRILQDQQSILRSMMQKETNRVTAEAIMRATLGDHNDQSCL